MELDVMDQTKKFALIQKVKDIQRDSPKDKEIVITVDDYFDGNDESCCTILANAGQSSSATFERFLRQIKNRDDVSNMFIRFYSYDDALDDPDSWINSDTVFVVTSASFEEVERWFESMEPSSVEEETDLSQFANLPSILSGHKLIAVWWD
jgi:hypothetical protein